MIYLFDDKKNRQEDYGWSNELLDKYNDFLTSIYSYKEIDEKAIKEIFIEGNTILFHESFFDNVEKNHQKDSLETRQKLITYSKTNQKFNLVIFSGSKNSRKLIDNSASLPVSVLYQNLKAFITKIEQGTINLEYLLFGENIQIEKELINKFEELNSSYNEKLDSK